jgi:hypothetical protein
VLDDTIFDASAWLLFTLVLLGIFAVVLTAALFVGLLIQFAVRQIRHKAMGSSRRAQIECVAQKK